MKYLYLLFSGLKRKKLRTGLTILSIMVAFLLFGYLSAIRQAFDAVGASMDMVETTGRMRYRLSHGDFDLPATKNGLLAIIEFALQGDAKKAAEIFEHFKSADSAGGAGTSSLPRRQDSKACTASDTRPAASHNTAPRLVHRPGLWPAESRPHRRFDRPPARFAEHPPRRGHQRG